MYGDRKTGNFRYQQLWPSTLFERDLLSVPCVEKDSNHRSADESQESHQENKDERIREKVLKLEEKQEIVFILQEILKKKVKQ